MAAYKYRRSNDLSSYSSSYRKEMRYISRPAERLCKLGYRDSLVGECSALRGGGGTISILVHWYRREPVHKTDHWSKLKCKSYQLKTLPTGNAAAYCLPEDIWLQKYTQTKPGVYQSTRETFTLAAVGNAEFNQYLKARLPKAPHLQPALGGSEGQARAPSACSQRAKLGFKYWNNPTDLAIRGKKSTMGSKGTFLGIGVPRL